MSFFTGTGIALMVALVLYSPSVKAQIEPDEFRRRTTNHIERVTSLGEIVRYEFPEYFSGLSPELVQEYLSEFHDAPKLLPLYLLREHGYGLDRSISDTLARYYGTNRLVNNLTEQEQSELNETIEELNRIEEEIKDRFFQEHGVSPSQKQALLFLERAVDLADTGMSRWVEMGVDKEKAMASNFVSQTKGQEDLLHVILWIEAHYEHIMSPVPVLSCGTMLQSVGR